MNGKGNWQKDPPTKPGIYLVAWMQRTIAFIDTERVAKYDHGVFPVDDFAGQPRPDYWWSEPIEVPPLPTELASGARAATEREC